VLLQWCCRVSVVIVQQVVLVVVVVVVIVAAAAAGCGSKDVAAVVEGAGETTL